MTDKKLKIGLFIDSYFPMIDGVVVVVDNYAKILNKEHKAFVAAPGKEKDNSNLNYKVHRCMQISNKHWSYSLPIPSLDNKFKKDIKKEKPDIIHLHSPFGVGVQGLKLAKKQNIPVVATIHSQFDQDFYKATKSKLLTKILIKKIIKVYNACDEVFVMNKKLEELLFSYGYKGKTRLISNATDMDYPKNPQELLDKANKTFNFTKNESVFLFVGRLIENKGILFLVKVMKVLKDNNFKCKMLFIGAGLDKQKLTQLVKKLNLENEVIIAGRVSERAILSSAYLRSDLFLFPSKYDTDGLVRKEAGAHKTPSLLAKNTMAGSLVIDNDTGFLAEFDEQKYANKIMQIMNNKELLKKVSENTYNKEHITWQNAVNNAQKAYKQIIKDYKN